MDPSSSSRPPIFPVPPELIMAGRMPNPNLSSQAQHFLALPRPDVTLGPLPRGLTDTTTLAAHDFDVDNRTGFVPPQPPLARLPSEWETWEAILDSALTKRLKLYSGPSTTDEDRADSTTWRGDVCKVSRIAVIRMTPIKMTPIADQIFHFTLASRVIN